MPTNTTSLKRVWACNIASSSLIVMAGLFRLTSRMSLTAANIGARQYTKSFARLKYQAVRVNGLTTTSNRLLIAQAFAANTCTVRAFSTNRVLSSILRSTPKPISLLRVRRFSDQGSQQRQSSVMAACWLLLGLNIIPYGLWNYAFWKRDQNLLHVLQDNTLVSLSAIQSGRWWTGITAAFTHINLFHFGMNMLAMHAMCQLLSMVPGVTGGHVIGIAFGAAIIGSAGYVLQQSLQARTIRRGNADLSRNMQQILPALKPALGASGAVMGLVAVCTCFVPTAPMNFMFIPISIPLWVVATGYAAYDGLYLNSQDTRIAHAGHLGGLAAGLVFYCINLRRFGGIWPEAVSHIIRQRPARQPIVLSKVSPRVSPRVPPRVPPRFPPRNQPKGGRQGPPQQ